MTIVAMRILHTEFATLLQHAKTSPEEFAQASGTPPDLVYQWCSGEQTVPVWAFQFANMMVKLLEHMTIEEALEAPTFEYYETLGIWNDPSLPKARKARRELAKKYHPQEGGGSTTSAMQKLNQAVDEANNMFRGNTRPIVF